MKLCVCVRVRVRVCLLYIPPLDTYIDDIVTITTAGALPTSTPIITTPTSATPTSTTSANTSTTPIIAGNILCLTVC